MKKTILLLMVFLLTGMTLNVYGQITTLWERHANTSPSSFPSWASTSDNLLRGLAYGYVNSNHRLYVLNGTSTTAEIYVLDATNGNNIQIGEPLSDKKLSKTGYTGTGSFYYSDVEVSDDGRIFVCCYTTNQWHNFRVNMWASEDGTPVEVLSYPNLALHDIGRYFTVVGDYSLGTAKIYVTYTKGAYKVLVFSQTAPNSVFSNSPTEITLSTSDFASNTKIYPLANNDFLLNGGGIYARRYNLSGTVLSSIPSGILGTGSSSSISFVSGTSEFLASFVYGSGNGYGRIINITDNNFANATLYGSTTSMQVNANANGTGDLSQRKNNDGTVTLFVLTTNNGLGAYTTSTGAIGWANLQHPATAEISTLGSVDIYARVWVDGATGSPGQGAGISAWIGYSTENTNPNTWTNWIPATYFSDQVNDDEYKVTLSGLAAGIYYYASRFQNQLGQYYYGGGGGPWNGTSSISGVLTVTEEAPVTDITWCNLQYPDAATVQTFNTTDVYAQIYIDGLTNPAGQGAGITCWIGYSNENTNPNTWSNWVLATYNTDVDNNDEYKGVIPNLPKGTYYYASRFQRNGGDYFYGGYNGGFWNGTTNVSGVLTVNGMSGTYYVGNAGTRPGGGNPDFLSLKSACDAVNTTTVDGNLLFYFTSSLTEPANVGLGKNPGSYTVTFKPYTGITPTINFTQVADNTGASGGWVIGVPNLTITDATNYGLVTTRNIIIDGSNTAEGTSRDLSITTQSGINGNTYPFRIFGDADEILVKNINVTANNVTSYGVLLTPRNFSSVNYLPDNVTLQNCSVTNTGGTSSQGLAISSSGTVTAYPSGIIFEHNLITARTRGIFLNNAGNTIIRNNEIKVSQTGSGFISFGILCNAIGTGSNINIYNNSLSQLSTANSAAGDYGIVGISCASNGTYNVYNNFLSGFEATTITENKSFVIDGIRVTSSTATANIFNNTIYLPNTGVATLGTGTARYTGIYISNGTNTVKNNIIVTEENDFVSHSIYRSGTSGTLTSDYNNFYRSGTINQIGYWNSANSATLDDWKTASTQDANSVSKQSYYVSSSDLHLTGNSVGDFDLAGTPLENVTTDIDGQTRSITYPYMGADENLNVPLAPYKRNVNGDFADWTGTPSGTVHATLVSNQEAIYKGEGGDARTDQHGAVDDNWKNNDISDFRFTRDNSFIYFGIKMNDITDINRPYIAITIDSDQSDDTPLWIGANSSVSLAAGNNRGWERQIALHAVADGVLGIQLFADDGASWYSPLSNYTIAGSLDNDVIEAKIALYDLGLNPNSTLRLSVASFNNNLAPFAEEVFSYIDIVTPSYSGTSNAWVRGGENNTSLNTNVQWDQSITPLPVELAGFTALPSGQKIDLKWTTKTEVNSYQFVIERSLKTEVGSQNALWEKVGEVNASGNSNSPKEYSFSDKNLAEGKYSYRLKMIDNDGTFEYSPVVEVEVEVPNTFALSQNYPNPFNPVTQIQYQLPVNSQVKLLIYTITGELVTTLVDENQVAGNYTVPFDASALASGTYIYRLVAGDFVSTKKMVVLK